MSDTHASISPRPDLSEEEYYVINSIKHRSEIKEDEKSYMLSIHVEEQIVFHLKQGCLCVMVPSVSWLHAWK